MRHLYGYAVVKADASDEEKRASLNSKWAEMRRELARYSITEYAVEVSEWEPNSTHLEAKITLTSAQDFEEPSVIANS